MSRTDHIVYATSHRGRGRTPTGSTNRWLVILIIIYSVIGLLGYVAASQRSVFKAQDQVRSHEQSRGPGGHGHVPLF